MPEFRLQKCRDAYETAVTFRLRTIAERGRKHNQTQKLKRPTRKGRS